MPAKHSKKLKSVKKNFTKNFGGNFLFFKKIVYWLSFAAISLILSFAIQIFAAWSPPTSTPPSDNVSAPLDASINFQTKTGALGVGGVFETNGNTYLASNIGNVGIGTTTPNEKLVLDDGNFLVKNGVIYSPSASIGNIGSLNATSTENMDIGNNLYVRTGINVGSGGINSNGVVVASSSLETLQFLRMRATSTSMICNGSNGNEGKMYYSSTGNEPCYCGGASGWLQFDGGGACP